MFKFEKLEVWNLALDLVDEVYDLCTQLPASERFNLSQQVRRAATSIALNIAEGSAGATDAEQTRFLGMANRSALEVAACLIIMQRRTLAEPQLLKALYRRVETLCRKLQTMRNAIDPHKNWIREPYHPYHADGPSDSSD